MIHVYLVAELPSDDFGPRETHVECLVLPPSFAKDALGAHAKLLTLLAIEEYFELPQHDATGLVPLNSETVRGVGGRRAGLLTRR